MVITNENFESVMNSGKPVVLDFWATWCGPCKKIAPVIEELAEQYADQVIVGKVDVEENDDISFKYGIRNIPTILFFKNGQLVDKQVGSAAKPVFVQKIEALL